MRSRADVRTLLVQIWYKSKQRVKNYTSDFILHLFLSMGWVNILISFSTFCCIKYLLLRPSISWRGYINIMNKKTLFCFVFPQVGVSEKLKPVWGFLSVQTVSTLPLSSNSTPGFNQLFTKTSNNTVKCSVHNNDSLIFGKLNSNGQMSPKKLQIKFSFFNKKIIQHIFLKWQHPGQCRYNFISTLISGGYVLKWEHEFPVRGLGPLEMLMKWRRNYCRLVLEKNV